jgi:branched-chain amino acid transport system permease protein
MQSNPKARLGYSLTILALIAATFVLPSWAVFLLSLSLARGLVVLGLLVIWRAGLMSFGQALYYCLGGYSVGLAGRYLGWSDAFLLVTLGTAVSVAVAVPLGFIISRYREIFFAMLSMAFSMILYGVLVKSEFLGSTDGFNVVPPTFLGWAPKGDRLVQVGFLVTLAVVVIAGFGVRMYLYSAAGHLATALRDNEVRVEYLGVSARAVVHAKYTLAAALAGAGGALSALFIGHIDPEMAYWTTSGEFVFITILGGPGSIAAPFLGAALFLTVRTYAFQYSPYTWQMVLGTMLLLLILFLPNGVWSLVQRGKARA